MEENNETKVVNRKIGEKPETRIVHRDFRPNPTQEEMEQDAITFLDNNDEFFNKLKFKLMIANNKGKLKNDQYNNISIEIKTMKNHIDNLIMTFNSLFSIANTTRGDYEKMKESFSMAIDCMQKQLIDNIKELGITTTDTFGV